METPATVASTAVPARAGTHVVIPQIVKFGGTGKMSGHAAHHWCVPLGDPEPSDPALCFTHQMWCCCAPPRGAVQFSSGPRTPLRRPRGPEGVGGGAPKKNFAPGERFWIHRFILSISNVHKWEKLLLFTLFTKHSSEMKIVGYCSCEQWDRYACCRPHN